ncbi:MAG TPA: O-acetyl-ADP-ribose deacetylase [Firmicutes bacterium]|nr:O-acetyl-ADP-ribose deacetylase [Bacillota bacterium]
MKIAKPAGDSTMELTVGDITKQDTEAIVNAANKQLAPGGGVAGAIHRAAGPGLWEECKKLGGCETGQAKITSGHNLPAKYVIHTVGPVYQGIPDDPVLLRSCYRNSLKLARDNSIKSISFPAISAGIFGYPIAKAAKVSLEAVHDFLLLNSEVKLVRFVLFKSADFEVYRQALERFIP